MSITVGWKRFKFFDDVKVQAQLPDNVSYACCDPDGRIWLGSTDGFVARLDGDLNLQTSFTAHQGCIKLLTVIKASCTSPSPLIKHKQHQYTTLLQW